MGDERQMEGLVESALPKGLYRVVLEDGKTITASISSAARRVLVRVIPGDRVRLEISAFDPTRGKISAKIQRKS
ncbi:MAG: translation initiation factor IF-1 [Myxococcales bacterium]|nr:translation initiation factor IF-1 [Myxococcales bacterium]